eukprot:9472441-Pyramimonas_sp.AAC.1
MGIFGRPAGSPGLDYFELPSLTTGRTRPHPFLLPHKFFRSLHGERPACWSKYMCGAPGAALEFWNNLADTPFVRQHPMIRPDMFSRLIPLGFHGDAGGFTEHESLLVLSWNSLLGSGTTRRKRFLFTVIRKKDYDKSILDLIISIFAWSMNVLLGGSMPDRDFEGRPVPGGGGPIAGEWRACLAHARGDWQWYCELFGFPKWNENERMCWMCLASATIPFLLYTDCSRGARRRGTQFTHETYVEHVRRNGLELASFFVHVVGFRLECVLVDVLHAADLGMSASIIGNILWETVANHMWGATTIQGNVKLLADDLKKWYESTKCPVRLQGELTKDRLRPDGKYPKLKAKAAATRYLADYALLLAKRFNDGTGHSSLKIHVADNLVQFYNLMSEAGQFFNDAEKKKFAEIGNNLSRLLSVLAAEAFAKDEKLWKYAPKVHLIEHLTQDQAPVWGNPRYFWTYADEDLVGLLVEVGKSCHVRTLPTVALCKWLIIAFDDEE